MLKLRTFGTIIKPLNLRSIQSGLSMTIQDIKLSPDFKSHTTKAIAAIIFFVLTYMLILLLAVGLTVASVYAGMLLISSLPGVITLIVGAGLASFGLLILVFLIKFVFKKHKIDRSHLYEIKKSDEPELYQLIGEIVQAVGTNFPKKVYLSTDVNAAVFYDSSFQSMFLPVKKNLQIGLGLVNTVTQAELKAILAHEFGHFSQRTMKVGSYVYNVNQVIFNMLFDNSSYEQLIHKWGNINAFISLFVMMAIKLIEGIQWLLRKLYEVVNKRYMALSREMEFHADEIAATLCGYEPLTHSLPRMTLADHAFNTVLSFYGNKIAVNQKSENVYLEQSYVLQFLAKENDYPVVNGLPVLTQQELNKFNKSKLVIKDQWASHPDTDERIERLVKTGIKAKQSANEPANQIFRNIEEIQKKLTDIVFHEVSYTGEVTALSLNHFQDEFRTDFVKNSFAKIYNGYYDNKNPLPFDINSILSGTGSVSAESVSIETLFSDEKVELVYTAIALANDCEMLKQIADKSLPVKTFDYEGIKYKAKESAVFMGKLQAATEAANEQIKQNDIKIFAFFNTLDRQIRGENALEELYKDLFAMDDAYPAKFELYTQLNTELQFLNFTTPSDQIQVNLLEASRTETKLKKELRALLNDTRLETEITKEIRDNVEMYLTKDWTYFAKGTYFDKNLEMMFMAINNYVFLLSRNYFLLKKKVLDYQKELLDFSPL